MAKKTAAPELRLRIRILRDRDILIGPGKADLLDSIRRRGNLRGAALDLGMSYMRAWKLVQMMNRAFRERLVELERGGAERGHAALTATGRTVLALYREMEASGIAASRPVFRRLARRVRP